RTVQRVHGILVGVGQCRGQTAGTGALRCGTGRGGSPRRPQYLTPPHNEYMASLDGRVILVTGAAKRIGRSIALRLAREGARVAIHYSESAKEALATAAECGNAPVFRADLGQVVEIQRLFFDVEQHFGRIDSLVNNAARFTRIDPLEITEADWDYIHDVNLKATFFCCQQAALRMMAGE